ncbi:mediator of DNA damage checkpoint protein 1 [Pezoporus occidentalis]|uniref:mediator of DNA damage checkpoint protein 1 n=1 Tax=Pezoporus occidentalis TaxID=407982 RepID=UPI002F915B34
MHRKHHQSLSTVGVTAAASLGQGPAAADPDVRPDVWSIRKRCRSPGGGRPADEPPPSPDPDVGGPKRQRLGAASAPDPDVEGPDNGGWLLAVDSDTDVEGEEPHPDVAAPSNGHNADVEGAPHGPGYQLLVLDSDTDVEEEEGGHPDAGPPRDPAVKAEPPAGAAAGDSDTDVEGGTSDPDMAPETPPLLGPRLQGLLVESDTDVEEDGGSPDVGSAKIQMCHKEHVLVTETPKPDVGGPQGVDTDTDGEDEDLTQCFLPPWKPPAVVLESPVPDVGAMVKPDVGTVPPDPAVSPASSDREEVAPTPDVRQLRSRVRFQAFPHPDVVGSGAETAPNSWKRAPKPRSSKEVIPSRSDVNPDVAAPSPDVASHNPDAKAPDADARASNPDVRSPNPDVVTPNPDVAPPDPHLVAPNPDVGAEGHGGNTPTMVPVVPMDASTPKSPHLDSCSGVTDGADGTESDSDDVDLFLEPTQSFLPPAGQGSPQGWDPEEPTQLFCRPQEEEEEEEEPPQTPPQAPPKEGTKEEGPRRSQRLARSRVGGAKGGVASEEVVGGAPLGPASLRRSPRLLARPLEEPRPPPAKPRPRRAGTGQSRRRAQDKKEEAIEVEAPQLRPRRSLGSSPPKVLFTGLVASEAMEVALGSLGGSVATSVFDCTHLVTDRIRRTLKFLCAVARGVPIVTPEWIHKSATSGRILAPGPFLVQDPQQEQHFGFSLAQALQRARRHPLLQGYEIHVTPSVRPEPEHMKDIITCSGGTFLPTMPSTYRPRRVVVSCPADAWCWAPALSSRLPLASPELLLTGLLRQRLQLQPFLLPPPTETPPTNPPTRNRGPPRTRRRPVGPPQ